MSNGVIKEIFWRREKDVGIKGEEEKNKRRPALKSATTVLVIYI